MNTWIFQGNPTRFNVDDYLLDNERIWWSIRQEHLAMDIQLGDEVFIWRSDGPKRGSGGIVARAQIISLPQEYKNDDDSLEYWYEDVSGDTYLAVEMKVLEEDVAYGINRTELLEHEHLFNMMILRLKQNTNYLLPENHSSYLRQIWYSRVPVNQVEINTRFPFVETIEDVIKNMKQFEADMVNVEKLEKQLPTFQQWYYSHELNLLAPSKFIGYKKMKGHLYVDKDAIAGTDGRATVRVLKKWFSTCDNDLLKNEIISKLNGRTRKEFSVNILKSEKEIIEKEFYTGEQGAFEQRLVQEFQKSMLAIYQNFKAIGYTPIRFREMIANEGGVQTAKKLINGKLLSSGFAVLAEKNRLDLTVEALVVRGQFRPLFTDEELSVAEERLSQMGYELKDEVTPYELPQLRPNNRVREYNFYSDELKAEVLFEHLINDRTHRWMDINILDNVEGNTNGRNSANVLYYLGIKGEYRGLFQEKELGEVIEILTDAEQDFGEAIRLLRLLDDAELDRSINSDLEAELAEEGFGIEGHIRYYYGKRFERNSKNRKLAIKKHGLDCFVCGFNFEEIYGERGKDFIEVHHIKPLSTFEEAVKVNPETDLVPLCANCHRMTHRRKDDVLNLESLKNIFNEGKR